MPAAFVVEDGTIVADANAYATIEFIDQYFLDRGGKNNVAWTAATQGLKETAIVRATDYIEARFSDRWVGVRTEDTQSLSWPREYAYDRDGIRHDDEVPLALRKAVAEYALRALTIVLMPDGKQPVVESVTGSTVTYEAVGPIIRKREKVGPIEEETEYARGSATSTGGFGMPSYPAADMLLKGILKGSANSVIR